MRKQILFACVMVLSTAALQMNARAQTPCTAADYDCQIKELTKAIQTDPRNIEAYYNLALAFQNKGLFKEAIELYSMYISAPVKDRANLADGHNNRAVSLRRLGRHEQALEDLDKAIQLNPKNPAFLTNRGNAYRDLRKFDLAIADYDRAIAVDPANVSAYIGRGHLHETNGNSAKAVADFTKAIKLKPDEPEAYYNRAAVRFAKREYAKAIPDYDKYIKLNPANPAYLADGYINRGIAHFYAGNPAAAIRDLTTAIEIHPTEPRAYKARAYIYRELKLLELAEADEKKAAEIQSPN